ncbi:MAG: hypothetical protein B6226_01655 [Candidatus Cloacimonetes bacterium 4572_65]|nr:MAG: hypothetical protein B6226_01655 [Candidatus Cloacimonetes bacterium 4572_65]
MNRGVIIGILAYILWGLSPIYWRGLQQLPALEILSFRMVGSLFFAALILVVLKRWSWLKKISAKQFSYYGLTSIFVTINWLVYIWSVNNNQVVEASLGYYMNPLVNVLLGELFLKERLRNGQRFAVFIAMLGVAFLTFKYGKLPWVSIVLAFSFAIYGLLKKRSKLGGLESFSLETVILSIPAGLYILYLTSQGASSFGAVNIRVDMLLIGAGVITGLPLILFNIAAEKLTLTTLGMLQYLSPTLQLLIGVFVFKEVFPMDKLLGFVIIWFALLLYTSELIVFNKRKSQKKKTTVLG